MVLGIFLLALWNPKIVSLKIPCEKAENLHEQRYMIKFCVKLKKMVTEMKEMLDAAYNGSAMSQASSCHWYNELNAGSHYLIFQHHCCINAISSQFFIL